MPYDPISLAPELTFSSTIFCRRWLYFLQSWKSLPPAWCQLSTSYLGKPGDHMLTRPSSFLAKSLIWKLSQIISIHQGLFELLCAKNNKRPDFGLREHQVSGCTHLNNASQAINEHTKINAIDQMWKTGFISSANLNQQCMVMLWKILRHSLGSRAKRAEIA